MDSFADGQLKMLESKWFRFFLSFDPRPTLEKVRCPVLALNGEKDLAGCLPRKTFEEIAKAIKKAWQHERNHSSNFRA